MRPGPRRKIYHAREDTSQEDHIDGLPFGTRGGMLIHHYFPADGDYVISWEPVRTTVGGLFGGDSEDEKLELTLDGQRLKLFQIGKDVVLNTLREKLDVRVTLKAGRHDVGATFLATTYVPNVDLNRHYQRSILDDNLIDGFTNTPQVSSVTISGPSGGARPTETRSRNQILTCKPSKSAEELGCARKILTSLAHKAYRRTLTRCRFGKAVELLSGGQERWRFRRRHRTRTGIHSGASRICLPHRRRSGQREAR